MHSDSLGADVEEIAIVLHHHLKLPHHLHKYIIYACTLLLPVQIPHVFLHKYIIIRQISTFGFEGDLITWAIL